MRASTIVLALGLVGATAATVVARVAHLGVQRGYAPAQPIAFSHRLHAGDNQIPCLYCHDAARRSRHAGIPSSSLCMNCHALLEKQTSALERIREAALLDRPLMSWVKVHNLPDFVAFNHSRHVGAGVACQRCHGPVETMERIAQVAPLTMGWCLECHREHAGIPAGPLARAARRLEALPPLASGLDCASCHH